MINNKMSIYGEPMKMGKSNQEKLLKRTMRECKGHQDDVCKRSGMTI
jgi:hypothetical protein